MTTASRARVGGGLIALAMAAAAALLLLPLAGVSDAAPKGGTRQKPKPAEPPALPAGTMELPPATPVKLPATVDAAVPGGGGKYLILHLRKLQQLAVFDVQQAKVLKYLPVASGDIAYTAGSEKLFVVLRDLKQIQRWNLADFKLEQTTPVPDPGRAIDAISIGADSAGPLVACSGHGKRIWQIDPKTLKAEPYPSKNWGNDGGAWGPTGVHVSFDGRTVVASGGGWAGIELGAVVDGRVSDVNAGWSCNGETLVAGNGLLVFPGSGGLLRRDLGGLAPSLDGTGFPAVDPAFSLALQHNRDRKATPLVALFNNADPRALLTMAVPELAGKSPLPLWQRFILIPRYNTLVTIATDTSDQLLVRPFDLTERLNAAGVDYLFAESAPPTSAARGKPFAYDLKVRSKRGGVKAELQAGPEGMTLSPDGKLRWAVPAAFPDAQATVIIQIADASGQTIFHTFILALPKPPDAVAANKPQPAKPAPAAPPPPARERKPEAKKPEPAKPTAPPSPTEASAATAAPKPENPAKVIELSEPFGEFHAADGGKRLVFYQPKAKQLAVYETQTGKQLGTIKLGGGDNVRFTCGKDLAVVALPDQRILQSYSLSTFKRLKSAPFPNTNPLRDLRMGNASGGPLFMYFGGELVAVDAGTLQPMKLRGKLPAGNPDWRFDFRPSADGSTVVCWDSYASPSNFTITRITGGKVSTVGSPEGFSMANRRFVPSANGSLVIYETSFYDASAKKIDSKLEGFANCVPTSDPRFLVAVNPVGGGKSDLALVTAADRRVLTRWNGVADVGDGGWDRGKAGLVMDMAGSGEPRVVLTPDTKTLALIPAGNNRIELLPVDLNAGSLATAGQPAGKAGGPKVAAAATAPPGGSVAVVSLPPAEVAVGATYSYQIQVVPETAKVQYKVESGPKGLAVSDKGLVTWKVIDRPVGGKVNVILSIVDPTGNETPHAFDIAVTREPVASSAGGGSTGATAPRGGTIVKLDEHRIELPTDHVRYTPGMGGRVLVLCDDQLAVLAPDGFTIKESRALPKSYVAIGERPDYYVALCQQEPRSIDLLDKRTLKVQKSRPVPFASLVELALHPERPISYVTYSNPGDLPRHHFLIFDERTAEARTDDNWIGQWAAVAPDGQFLLTGFQETYQKGHDIIDNPDRIWIVPTYGSIDSLARYELNAAGVPVRVAHREGVGGNGQGIRLSDDGKRAAYLSVGGYPDLSRNLAGWNPLNLRDLPVAYLTKDVATCADLAFHPLLALVASHGKGSVAFYDRESGEALKDRVNDDEIAGEDIQQVYFSPDGKMVLLHTVVQSVHYLYHTPLKLSADETKAVRALPRPDRPLRREERLPAKPGGESRKLPQVQARSEDGAGASGLAG
jgi:hypothetical protein